MRRMLLVALILVGLVVVACGGGSEGGSSDDVAGSDPDRPDPGAVASVEIDRAEENLEAREGTALANAAFALDLYRELVVDGENFVFSPYSAAVALGMARAGARGQTAVEMDAVLHADLAGDLNAGFNAIDRALAQRPGEFETFDGSLRLELSTANAIWSQIGLPLETGFLEVLGRDYGAGVRLVDYAQDTEGARQAINGWVSDQTNQRIPMLVAPGVVTASTRLVLTNAIYLNAPWAIPFSTGTTQAFHLLDDGQVDAAFMRLDLDFPYLRGEDFQAFELAYIGGELSMVVIVPDEGRFAEVEAALTDAGLLDLPGNLSRRELQLQMPKFEFRVASALSAALKNLGMPTAFGGGADFSGITQAASLFISEVVHEAFIAVDELGTEAAAATAVAFDESAPADPVQLIVDRPFLFLIRDVETNTILFLGRVLDPTQ